MRPGPALTATNGGPAVGQWYLKPPPPAGSASAAWGTTAPAAINAEEAWGITTGSASVVVAVLDTGLRFDHSDLQGGNVLPGYDMASADSPGVFTSANDGDGRDADASDPGDFVTDAEAGTLGCSKTNSSWHGTQTLGLIGAATNNGVGMASVGRTVRVMPVRVLGKCGGYDSDIQAGILWAAGIHVPNVPDNTTPARVINMSLGGDAACTQGYIDAIGQANAAGAVVVASAGNSSGHPVSSPANCPGAIAVAALRHVGDKVGFSDIGPQITIAAPGGNCVNTNDGEACLYPIVTTTNKGTTTPVVGPPGAAYTDAFDASLGTSFSAPLVAGTAALMFSVNPSLTPAQVKAKLQSSARPFPTTGGTAGTVACVAPAAGKDQLECYCTTLTCGAGMLDAHAAVLSVSGVQASISLQTTTPTAGQAVALSSASALNAGQSIATLRVDDPQRGNDRRDDHQRRQRRLGRRLADGGRLVRHPADDHRQQRLRLDHDAVGGRRRACGGDVAGVRAGGRVVGRRRRARRRLAAAPARGGAVARARLGARARGAQRGGRSARGQGLKLKPRPAASSLSVASRAVSVASGAITR